jgi:hypothetical protein
LVYQDLIEKHLKNDHSGSTKTNTVPFFTSQLRVKESIKIFQYEQEGKRGKSTVLHGVKTETCFETYLE